MNQISIQKEIDAENRRQSRIDEQLAVTLPHQMKRYEAIQQKTENALYRVHGNRLSPQVIDRMVAGLILEPSVLCSIGSSEINEMPSDNMGWDRMARDLVEREPLAQLSIQHSDAELKEKLRQEITAAINPSQRLAMARSGELDNYVDQRVTAKLDERAGF